MNHCRAFIDESGDFGLSKGASRYVIMAAIFLENLRRIEKVPNRVRRIELGNRATKNNIELSFHSESDSIRKHLLEDVSRIDDLHIGIIILDKSRIDSRRHSQRESAYLLMCKRLVEEIVRFERIRGSFEITFHRSPFHRSVTQALRGSMFNSILSEYRRMRWIPPKISMQMRSSEGCNGLIVTDFIAGSAYRKYSSDDPQYYEIIKDAICFEKEWR